MSKKERFIAK